MFERLDDDALGPIGWHLVEAVIRQKMAFIAMLFANRRPNNFDNAPHSLKVSLVCVVPFLL